MLKNRHTHYFFAFLVLFLLFFLEFLQLLELHLVKDIANAWKSKNYAVLQTIHAPFVRLQNIWNLSARLEDLQYRYSEAAAIAVKVENLEQENQELKKMLENSDRDYRQVIVSAPVVSFARSYVAVGANAGVKTGAAVLHQGTLLGFIDQVDERQSSVTLLLQMHERAVLAQTSQEAKGLVKGNGRELLLTEVAHDMPLAVGDLVFTQAAAGLEGGLLIGRVAQLRNDNQALATQIAVVEQLVNFFEVRLVEIQ